MVYELAKLVTKRFDNEKVFFIQNTIFRTPSILYYGSITIVNIVFVISLLEEFNYIVLIGVFIVTSLYFNRSIYKKLLPNFEYNKYNTSVQYYQSRYSEAYRNKVYEVITEKIKNFNWNRISDEQYRKYFMESINPHWKDIISFEKFDEKLSKSKANTNIGRLTYYYFTQNILSTIKDFEKQLVQQENIDKKSMMEEIFHSSTTLKFNDKDGFHYDTELINAHIKNEKGRIIQEEIFEKIDSALFLIKNSNLEIKDSISFELNEIKESIMDDVEVNSKYKLPEDVSEYGLLKEIIDNLEKTHKMSVNSYQERDLRLFIKKNFKNKNGGGIISPKIFCEYDFLKDNAKTIAMTIVNTKGMDINKKETAKIIAKEFDLKVKTVERWLKS